MIDFWNERYDQIDYVYGTRPNVFFKNTLDALAPGKLLLPSEGEGRNAVYAAYHGWEVDAYDYSEVAQLKALNLAKNTQVKINYSIAEHRNFVAEPNSYDAVALIYAHATPEERLQLHKMAIAALKPGGTLILEAFSKGQLGKESGGPQKLELLYDIPLLEVDFKLLTIKELKEEELELSEGTYHRGNASVVRMVAVK